ncbi:hypothetical protein H0E87_006810 [Populus deltoides]|uniref:Uncharacterized protein n=1 Tax=Populus deltoides TaxID=3696 RepID=A0A8T2Z8T8_POPDE|nr:hypothetical protein H0E87_006810 [Populus deltoides]
MTRLALSLLCNKLEPLGNIFHRTSVQIVPASFTVSASGKDSIKLPAGYHGNAFTSPVALTKAGLPCKNSLEYGLGLVKETKNRLGEELAMKGRKQYRTVRDSVIADATRVPFGEIDFGRESQYMDQGLILTMKRGANNNFSRFKTMNK